MKYQSIRTWAVAVLAVAGGFLAAGVLGAFVADWLGRWDLPVSGLAAAFAVVVTAYAAAPTRRLTFSVCAFIVGALTALWLLRGGSWYPESYSNLAYQQTYLPLWATLAGGVVGLVVVFSLDQFHRRKIGPNKTYMDSPRK